MASFRILLISIVMVAGWQSTLVAAAGTVPQDFTVWSVGGSWTCGGRPTSITQDGHNHLLFTNENGLRSKGSFLNTDTVVATEWENGLRGSVQDGGNTIQWANGTVWYRNQTGYGQSGSLPSLSDAWICDGKPTSITQDAGGNLVFTNQMGWKSKGRFADAATVIATEWENGLRGSLQDGGNTIRWANGTAWFRSGPTGVRLNPTESLLGGVPSQGRLPSLGGAWICDGKPTSITQDGSGNLVFTNQMGMKSKGRFADAGAVIATEWENGLRGSLQDGGNTIRWANGTAWFRSSPAAGAAVTPSLAGVWTCDGRPTSITQDGSGNLVFTNQMGMKSKGRFADASTVIATEWENGLRGSLQDNGNTIRWANGTAWYRGNR